MKKCLLLMLMVFPLMFIGCANNNKIIGTWIRVKSAPKDNTGVSSGSVTYLTFNNDGTFEEKTCLQIGVDSQSSSDLITILGTWEMKDENTLSMDAKTVKAFGETRENHKITEYAISRLDDESLEMMEGGKELKYRRK